MKDAAIGMWANMNAVGRWGDPEDMEGAALFGLANLLIVDGPAAA